jgi:hypothetical protein
MAAAGRGRRGGWRAVGAAPYWSDHSVRTLWKSGRRQGSTLPTTGSALGQGPGILSKSKFARLHSGGRGGWVGARDQRTRLQPQGGGPHGAAAVAKNRALRGASAGVGEARSATCARRAHHRGCDALIRVAG